MLVCITESCEKKKQDTPVFFSFFFSSPLLEDGYLTKETGAKIGRLFFFSLFRLHVVVCLFFFLLSFSELFPLFFFFTTSAAFCVCVFFFSIFLFSFGSLVHKRSGSEDVQTRAFVFTSVSFLFVYLLTCCHCKRRLSERKMRIVNVGKHIRITKVERRCTWQNNNNKKRKEEKERNREQVNSCDSYYVI